MVFTQKKYKFVHKKNRVLTSKHFLVMAINAFAV